MSNNVKQLLTWEECRQQIIELGKFKSGIDGRFCTSSQGFMNIYNSKKSSLLKASVNHLTLFLPKDASNKERVHHILYNKKEYINPKCSACGKKPNMGTISHGYLDYCSRDCSDKDKEKAKRVLDTKLKRYGKKGITNPEKIKQTKLERYGNKNYNNREKGKQTYFEKTGFETPFSNPNARELSKETRFEKYGDENYNNREKFNNTLIERYGSKSYRNHEQGIKTTIERYGSIHNAKEKQRNTSMQRYGVEYPLQSAEKRSLADDTREMLYGDKNFRNHPKRIQTLIDTVGSDWHSVIFKSYSKISQELFWEIYNRLPTECQIHTHFGELNGEYRIMYDTEKRSNYFYDFCITSLKLMIEFDGTYWHSLEGAKERDQHKQFVAEEKGFKMIRVNEADYYKDKQGVINGCVNEIFEIKDGELV